MNAKNPPRRSLVVEARGTPPEIAHRMGDGRTPALQEDHAQDRAPADEGRSMSAATRIYAVADKKAGECHLVRAASQAQAVRHVVRRQFVADVATQQLDLLSIGKKVEEADADAAS